jgi:hypothetical protein
VRWLLDFAIALARAWTASYTRGLPHDIRAERREEIDSDLWEQQWLAARRGDPALGTAIEVLTRMLFGVISDITWRAQAGAPAPPHRSIKMSESWYMRALVIVGVVLALFLILSGIAAWYWMLVITIPIGIAIVAVAFVRARQTGGALGIGGDRMDVNGQSRRKWLLLVIGVCVATVVGIGAYAFSLEEWGDTRVTIFGLGWFIAVVVGLIALVLLISDLIGSVRRKTDS